MELTVLRARAVCEICFSKLPPRTEAWWDEATRQATCVTCERYQRATHPDVAVAAPVPKAGPPAAPTPPAPGPAAAAVDAAPQVPGDPTAPGPVVPPGQDLRGRFARARDRRVVAVPRPDAADEADLPVRAPEPSPATGAALPERELAPGGAGTGALPARNVERARGGGRRRLNRRDAGPAADASLATAAPPAAAPSAVGSTDPLPPETDPLPPEPPVPPVPPVPPAPSPPDRPSPTPPPPPPGPDAPPPPPVAPTPVDAAPPAPPAGEGTVPAERPAPAEAPTVATEPLTVPPEVHHPAPAPAELGEVIASPEDERRARSVTSIVGRLRSGDEGDGAAAGPDGFAFDRILDAPVVPPGLDPDLTLPLDRGDMGEGRVGQTLEAARVHHLEVLHGLRVSADVPPIDHLVVAVNGVWVVHAVPVLEGRLERRDLGDWFNADPRLHIADVDRSELVAIVRSQVEAVTTAVAQTPFSDIPVRGVLCFGSIQPGWVSDPFVLDGISVTWRRRLVEPMLAPVLIDVKSRTALLHALAGAVVPGQGAGARGDTTHNVAG